MAITGFDIIQDNTIDGCNLLSVHNPLVFLANAYYETTIPDNVTVNVYDEYDTLLGSYKAIPYKDVSFGTRTFAFIADGILRSLMESIDDIYQDEKTLIHIPNLTKRFTIEFQDIDDEDIKRSVSFIATHASSQFGEKPYQLSIFQNSIMTYVCAENKPVYVYYYNDSTDNTITMSDVVDCLPALDYDEEFFADYDDQLLCALFENPGAEPSYTCSQYGELPFEYYETVPFELDIYDCTFNDLEP